MTGLYSLYGNKKRRGGGGRASSLHHNQGDALGYVLVPPSGRALNACAYSLIQLAKREKFIEPTFRLKAYTSLLVSNK